LKLAIIGAGGVGGFLGAALKNAKEDVTFIARGKHLEAMQKDVLHVKHPNLDFCQKVDGLSLDEFAKENLSVYDGLIILAKSNETENIAKILKPQIDKLNKKPFIISLQNGVGNEELLCQYFSKDLVIGGLVVKISAHIKSPGHIEALGESHVIVGGLSEKSKPFLNDFKNALEGANVKATIAEDIRKELWRKLIINNGVNALCALLEVKTGFVTNHPKLSQIVLGLMNETARAAQVLKVNISKEDVDEMFALIRDFDSIKPSMLVDVEQGRRVELEAICGVVIKTLQKAGIDAPYTKTVSYLLEYKLQQ